MSSILCRSVAVTETIPAHRFVSHTGGLPVLRGTALGVSRSPADAAGQLIPVDVLGVVTIESADAIAAGEAVETTADGRATPLTIGAKVGRALDAAPVAGQFVRVLLIHS